MALELGKGFGNALANIVKSAVDTAGKTKVTTSDGKKRSLGDLISSVAQQQEDKSQQQPKQADTGVQPYQPGQINLKQQDKKEGKESAKKANDATLRNTLANATTGIMGAALANAGLGNGEAKEGDRQGEDGSEDIQLKPSVDKGNQQDTEKMLRDWMGEDNWNDLQDQIEKGRQEHDERMEREGKEAELNSQISDLDSRIYDASKDRRLLESVMAPDDAAMLSSIMRGNSPGDVKNARYIDELNGDNDYTALENLGNRSLESLLNDEKNGLLDQKNRVANGEEGSDAAADAQDEAEAAAALGGIYGKLTADDWDNMTQRQQFMWAFANDEDLRNQLAAINDDFNGENMIGDYDEDTKNYTGKAYETFRGLDQDQLAQAVNTVFGLWDDDDSTGLRGWGDYSYDKDLASDMSAEDIAAYMIKHGLDVNQYFADNANYDYEGKLGNDPVTFAMMEDYILNTFGNEGDTDLLYNVFGSDPEKDLSEYGLDKYDIILGILADYQDRYGYIGGEDPNADLNYLLKLGGEKNPMRSTDASDTSGRLKDPNQARQYNIIQNLANMVQVGTDENGNPVGGYDIKTVTPYTDNQGDNPLLDWYLTDTFAKQYANRYNGKQLVQ